MNVDEKHHWPNEYRQNKFAKMKKKTEKYNFKYVI